MTRQKLIYHPLVSRDSTLAIDLEIMRRTGFEGLEASAAKMRAFLAAGWSEAELADLLRVHGVHICDSLAFGGGIPIEAELRDVPTGQGVLDLRAWTDAVKATGYVGWWSCELFCRRQHQANSFAVASELQRLMTALVHGTE